MDLAYDIAMDMAIDRAMDVAIDTATDTALDVSILTPPPTWILPLTERLCHDRVSTLTLVIKTNKL